MLSSEQLLVLMFCYLLSCLDILDVIRFTSELVIVKLLRSVLSSAFSVVHTCDPIMELSATYQSYNELSHILRTHWPGHL